MTQPKIAILRWESGRVPEGLLQLEELAGNSTNVKSYPFPVKFVEVKGANTQTIIVKPSKEILNKMIDICKCLIDEGIEAITTSCGFNAIFQKELSEAIDVPIFTSSLLQVPFAQQLAGENNEVAILTANASALTEEHLRNCGITTKMNPVVVGLEESQEWAKIFSHENEPVDLDVISKDIESIMSKTLKKHPNIKAIVLECTDLPPFARMLRDTYKMPVFDINSLIMHVAQSINVFTNY